MITLGSTHKALQAEYKTLEASNMTIQAELVKANETITALTEEKNVLNKRIEELTSVPANTEALEKLTVELDITSKSLSSITEENTKLVAKITELETKSTNFEEMVADKALEVASSQGVPPLNMKPNAAPSSSTLDNDLVGKYNSILNRSEQRAFWEANRDELQKRLK